MRIFYHTHHSGEFAERRGIAFDVDDDSKLTQESSLAELTLAGKLAGPWFKCDDCKYAFCEWDLRPLDKRFPDYRGGQQNMCLNEKGVQTCFGCWQERRRQIRQTVIPAPKKANRPQPIQMPSRIVPAAKAHPIQADDKMKAFLAANGQKTNAEKFGGAPA